MVSLGVFGEYSGRVYEEVKGRPLYLVRETAGINKRKIAGQAERQVEIRSDEAARA